MTDQIATATNALVQVTEVVWKMNHNNGHFIVGLKGTPAYKPFGDWSVLGYQLDYVTQRVCKRLLDAGGQYVLYPESDYDEEQYQARGEFFSAEKCKFVEGIPSNCHWNAAVLWKEAEPGKYTIGTGYALSKDGMWRQHSFLVNADGTITETTVSRINYFGYRMTDAESESLWEWAV